MLIFGKRSYKEFSTEFDKTGMMLVAFYPNVVSRSQYLTKHIDLRIQSTKVSILIQVVPSLIGITKGLLTDIERKCMCLQCKDKCVYV